MPFIHYENIKLDRSFLHEKYFTKNKIQAKTRVVCCEIFFTKNRCLALNISDERAVEISTSCVWRKKTNLVISSGQNRTCDFGKSCAYDWMQTVVLIEVVK